MEGITSAPRRSQEQAKRIAQASGTGATVSLIRTDLLRAFADRGSQSDDSWRPVRIPYPSPSGVLYARSNPDSTRKRCGNCWKFVTNGTCMEVAGEIAAEQVCGYHAFGKSQPTVLVTEAQTKIRPIEAGLIDTPDGEGTSCDLCRFFEQDINDATLGLCNAIGGFDGLPPVIVEPMGCCARWEVKSGL